MSEFNILITDGMAKGPAADLQSVKNFNVTLRDSTSVDDLKKLAADANCIVVRSATTVTREIIDLAPQLKLILRAGAGVDNIDVAYATEKNIPVMNTASANAMAAAEHTIALMFSMLRSTPQASLSLREKRWDRKTFVGFEATGKTIGVLGLGNIGSIVAQKAIGLGMNVLGYDPMIKSTSQLPSFLANQSESFVLASGLDEVFEKSNILTLHIPKTKDTANIINKARLETMQNGSFIINCSRGGLVVENAVLAALESGKLRGAAFDVYDPEPPAFDSGIFDHPQIVCTPHLGASTVEAQERVGATAASQIKGFFLDGKKAGIINGI